jgi:hypothetical protein
MDNWDLGKELDELRDRLDGLERARRGVCPVYPQQPYPHFPQWYYTHPYQHPFYPIVWCGGSEDCTPPRGNEAFQNHMVKLRAYLED